MTTTANPFQGKATRDQGAGGNFPVPGEDTHLAALVALIDLGTHEESYKGEDARLRRKVLTVWELNEAMPGVPGCNFVIGREYTVSVHEKAGLRQLAEALRRRKYGEGEEIDYRKMLGVNAAVTVAHSKSADGEKTYAKVAGIAPPMKGAAAFVPYHKLFAWFIGCGEPVPDLDWLPRVFGETIADKIGRSAEMRGGSSGGNGQKNGNGHRQEVPPADEGEVGGDEGSAPENSEIPF